RSTDLAISDAIGSQVTSILLCARYFLIDSLPSKGIKPVRCRRASSSRTVKNALVIPILLIALNNSRSNSIRETRSLSRLENASVCFDCGRRTARNEGRSTDDGGPGVKIPASITTFQLPSDCTFQTEKKKPWCGGAFCWEL